MITDKHFIDWESNTFGYGYGTGEEHTIPALKAFLGAIDKTERGTYSYDYEKLEKTVGKTVAWLFINILCHVDMIDYGTSPRAGWLNEKGILLKEFTDSKTDDELYDLTSVDEDYVDCYPNSCNCGPNGYVDGEKCDNPLF